MSVLKVLIIVWIVWSVEVLLNRVCVWIVLKIVLIDLKIRLIVVKIVVIVW